MREVRFTAEAWDAYTWWQGQDRKTLKRINTLIQSVQREPFEGICGRRMVTPALGPAWQMQQALC